MRFSEVLFLLVNEEDGNAMASAIKRAAAHCRRASQALVLDLTSHAIDLHALRAVLQNIMDVGRRPPAVSVIVAPSQLPALSQISLAMAHQGIILGDFSDRGLAEAHALRERLLVLAELEAASASTVRSARSISAKARA